MAVHSFNSRINGRERTHFLGMRTPPPGAIKLKLAHYFALSDVVVPKVFGFVNNTIEWGALGNDRAGCCVVSGAAHEHMTWTRAATNKMTPFSDDEVLHTYMAASGWDGRSNSNSDVGLDPVKFAEYRRTVGLRDAAGKVHRVRAYAEISHGDINNIARAAFIFGAVGIAIQVPQSCERQFDAQEPWTPVRGSPVMGGHYVPVEGRNSKGNLLCITWGRLQAVSPEFLEKHLSSAIAYITDDFLASGKTPRGFDLARLDKDLAQLR